MMRGATRNQQCLMFLWRGSWQRLSSSCPWVKRVLRHMHGVWQPCWLATSASMVGSRFVVLAILPGLHTSFRWAILAKAHKQLWKDFTHNIVCGTRGGRIRISLAPYNDASDVDTLVEALARTRSG